MKAELPPREKFWLAETLRVELVVWRVPLPAPGSTYAFKYRLVLVSGNICVL